MIDGGRVRIRNHRQAPLDALETLVIVLGGGEDGPQRIAQGIKGINVGGRDGRHERDLVEGSGCW